MTDDDKLRVVADRILKFAMAEAKELGMSERDAHAFVGVCFIRAAAYSAVESVPTITEAQRFHHAGQIANTAISFMSEAIEIKRATFQ